MLIQVSVASAQVSGDEGLLGFVEADSLEKAADQLGIQKDDTESDEVSLFGKISDIRLRNIIFSLTEGDLLTDQRDLIMRMRTGGLLS